MINQSNKIMNNLYLILMKINKRIIMRNKKMNIQKINKFKKKNKIIILQKIKLIYLKLRN